MTPHERATYLEHKRTTYAQRRADVLERLAVRAERRRQEATATLHHAHQMAAVIPFGQPLLVGHHSYTRDRNYRDRIGRTFEKALSLENEANDLHRRRDAAQDNTSVRSDNPDAIALLTAQVASMLEEAETMKRANAFYRKHGTLAGCPIPPELAEDGASVLRFQPYYGRPFPAYKLSNLSGNRRRLEQRIEVLQRQHAAELAVVDATGSPTVCQPVTGGMLMFDLSESRGTLTLAARLAPEDFRAVRRAGWLWSHTRRAFTRRFAAGARLESIAAMLYHSAPFLRPTTAPIAPLDGAEV